MQLFSMVLEENGVGAFVVGALVKASALVELETQSALVELKELVHYWWSWRL